MPRPKIKGKGQPAPDPPNAWDTKIIEGPDWREIQDLLEETTQIAEADWTFRELKKRLPAIWLRLSELGVTIGRMVRAYAIDGKPIITHVTILKILQKHGYEPKTKQPTYEERKP